MSDCKPLDVSILRILGRDGHILFEDLAARLSTSPRVVALRLAELRAAGRIWYTPRLGWHLKE